jgi:quercetin dioxygenase-like cupin family protein
MRVFASVVVGVAVLAGAVPLVAQDVVKVDPAHYKVLIDNAAVRVARVTYGPGDKSPMHSHPDSVVVILRGGKMRFTAKDGTNTDSDTTDDSAIYSPAGSHANTNLSPTPIEGILIEFKTPAPGKAVIPAARPGIVTKVLAEGPRAVVNRSTADPTFVEPPGTVHDFDQVVIALMPAQLSLTIAGKPAKTSWVRGDVVWIARGTAHDAKHTGGKSADFAVVSIR